MVSVSQSDFSSTETPPQYFTFTNRIPFLWHRNYIMVSRDSYCVPCLI